MLFYISLVFIMFPVVTFSQTQACVKLTLVPLQENVISLLENSFLNVTFGIDASSCPFRTSYAITVNTRTLDGKSEYDGSMTLLDGTCSDTRNTSVRCISPTGPGQLYRKVNRSHVQTQWEWKWKDPQSGRFMNNRKELNLNVLYTPSVISMTINGHEANSRQLINEGQINISCLFDKGNPPADCSLLDRNRKQLHHLRSENLLIYSLTVQCQDEWPVLHCEGKGSDKNRSVSLLVKCRPQFVDKHPKVISDTEYEKWIFNVRAHTTKLESCFLSSLPLEENSNKEIKCTLTGDPPDLLLTVDLNKEDSDKEGEWTLSLLNEKGFSDPLVFSKISRSTNMILLMLRILRFSTHLA
ncbi:uncharacterized protein LOC112568551 [Pomacea canaliculata]|uniref:uncharacterized protein LOC112568551 n=1 Tax=Pomacea canaliculata TaxID=400727 RepID=UPI000D7362B2|nr:uncharacterized protein LOC112568551 [Pomacea canaliculata]XP_025101664.1 uncharacterized protein LOC112568551 [Pomacea canaliculata]